MLDQPARAGTRSAGIRVVEVTVDGGYRPAVINARAGEPLRLVFHRLDGSECAERVVFSAPRLERHLAPAGTTVVDLPPQPPGEVRFTCGMGRFVGRIELTEAPGSVPAQWRRKLGQLEAPLGTALLLWIVSLPLIALLAVLTLDTTTALVVAATALAAWIAACVWVFDRHHLRFRRP